MHARLERLGRWTLLTALIGTALSLPSLLAQVPQPAAPPKMSVLVDANLKPGDFFKWKEPPPPKVSIVLKDRHGHAMPSRTHFARAGGGNTDVAQPSEDKLIITMSGVVTAGPQPMKANAAAMDFDLNQEFEIEFTDPKVKKAKLIVEAQVIGLLRGDRNGGSASVSNGAVTLTCAKVGILSLAIEGHSVCGDDNLSINDHKGPVSMALPPGDFHLRQTFRINADHARSILGKAAAAEFGPDPALDPTWISITDPFHGASKKEFGFRVTLRVEPE